MLSCSPADNGPQFAHNVIFDVLIEEIGINHRKVTPYHPEDNDEVEINIQQKRNL